MTTILPNITYRIQNVEYQTFMECRDDGTTMMRPLRDSANQTLTAKQSWYLSTRDDKRFYELRCAYPIGIPGLGPFVLQYTHPIGPTVTDEDLVLKSQEISATNFVNEWRVHFPQKVEYGTEPYFCLYHKTSSSRNFILVYAGADGKIRTEKDNTMTTITNFTRGEEFLWKLSEVGAASLPEPKEVKDPRYRIRTLNGAPLYAETETLLKVEEKNEDLQRHWLIVDKGNGQCTIQNARLKKFLAVRGNSSRWYPSLGDTIDFFRIQPIGTYSYSICAPQLYSDNRGTPLSLTVDDKTVALKPLKTAHNQIWLIEAADAALASNNPTDNNTANPGVTGPTLTNGSYKLSNERQALYLRVDARGPTHQFIFDVKGEANDMDIRVSNGTIRIFYNLGIGGNRYLSIENGKLVSSTSEFVWTIAQSSTAQHFYIYSGTMALCANMTAATASGQATVQARTSGREESWLLDSF